MAKWNITLALDAQEVEAVEEVAVEMLGPGEHGVITEISPDGSAGDLELVLDVSAESPAGRSSEHRPFGISFVRRPA